MLYLITREHGKWGTVATAYETMEEVIEAIHIHGNLNDNWTGDYFVRDEHGDFYVYIQMPQCPPHWELYREH